MCCLVQSALHDINIGGRPGAAYKQQQLIQYNKIARMYMYITTSFRFARIIIFFHFFARHRLTLSLPKANLTKPRKLLNPELSDKRCNHSNESSPWVLSAGGVHIVAEHSSCFSKCHVNLNRETMATKGLIYLSALNIIWMQFQIMLLKRNRYSWEESWPSDTMIIKHHTFYFTHKKKLVKKN